MILKIQHLIYQVYHWPPIRSGFVPSASLGALGPKDGVANDSKFAFVGQTTEQAATRRLRASEIFLEFTVPAQFDGEPISKVSLLWDFIFLTDDLGDLLPGSFEDFYDDDRITVTISVPTTGFRKELLKIDSDEVFNKDNVTTLVPPQTPSDPSENTGFEFRTGTALPKDPYLTAFSDITGLKGQKVFLAFFIEDPDLGNFLESGIIVDEIRLNVAPIPEPVTMLLFGTGLAGLVGLGMKKKFKK
jgi:hypothetical protein